MIYDLLGEVAESLEVVSVRMTAVNRTHLAFARERLCSYGETEFFEDLAHLRNGRVDERGLLSTLR